MLDCLERINCKIDVYDYDRFGFNDHMGRAYMHASELLAMRGRGPQDRWLPLGQKHPGETKEVTGDILVRIQVDPLP